MLTKRMTTEEMLALPAGGMSRWLIDGRLREKPKILHDRFHAGTMANLAGILGTFIHEQPKPRGQVGCGNMGIVLGRDPDTVVGVDLAYISPQTVAAQSRECSLVEGIPTLIVEILASGDRIEEINEKTAAFRRAGVPLVWIVDPYGQTVVVHRLGAKPQLFNTDQELAAEPHLPGFRVAVAELFAG
jgi:Uma2 family endonuclease